MEFYYEKIIFEIVRRDTSIYAINMKLNMLLLVGLFFWTNTVLGEGSKDLYPKDVKGNRAFLVSQPFERSVFSNQASHYAYAKEGETIAVASSAQNIGQGRIILTAPDGKIYHTKSDNIGQIGSLNGSTRAAELAGPVIGYTPYQVSVGAGQSGIWRIEFTSPDNDFYNASLIEPYNIRADGDWIQNSEGSLIAAWDISIRNVGSTTWLTGRIFMSVLQLHLSRESLADPNGAFYGRNYVLTKDGYIYHVDGNGSHGIDFAYFVNSSGMLDEDGKPTYKSTNNTLHINYHNPNDKDNDLHVTHKMFYNFPDTKMPKESQGCFPGGRSWLINRLQDIEVKDIGLIWKQVKEGRVNEEGTFVHFETNYSGRYKVVIAAKSDQYDFAQREFNVDGVEGSNSFFWDGLDGAGNPLPIGKEYKIGISVSLIKGEIHFPYFDMEINPNGILVDRMNIDGSRFGDAMLYWNDTEITAGQPSESSKIKVNKKGSLSRIDGHRWGSYSPTKYVNNGSSNGGYGAYSYGNDCVMDTWTYTMKLQAEVDVQISIGMQDDDKDGETSIPRSKEIYLELYQGGEGKIDLLDKNESFKNVVKVEVVDSPLYGTLTITDQTGTYKTKGLTFVGDDEFSCKVKDGNDKVIAVSKVFVKILKTNPIAKDDFFEIVYNAIDVSEIVNNDFVEHSYINNESIRIVDLPQNGILVKDNNGNWIYHSNDGYMGKDQFTYQIMDANGNWSNIATVNILINGLFIPNTITPNNDFKNDTFKIRGLSNFDQAEISIVDRFGRLVFSSTDYKNDWITPSNLASGVYFYVFKGIINGKKPVLNKGSLTVLASMGIVN